MDTGKISDTLAGRVNNVEYFDEIDSTNDYAKKNNSPDNTLILCDYQTEGRGRFKRKWDAVKGEDLTFTLVKSFKLAIDDMQLVNFYTTYVTFSALKELLGENSSALRLKWPNDILIGGKKICGILIEVKDVNKLEKRFIIGIGINVNQESFPDDIKKKATSILIETGEKLKREDLLLKIMDLFYGMSDLIGDKESLFSLWKDNFEHMGKKIKIRKFVDDIEVSALVKGLRTDGGLELEMEDGSMQVYYSGEISLTYDN